ncbi:hypothetical protein [Lacinutrix jangbogonensis]|uniref:hypothetical protein n=1 Tax=Lacinutrix jangbogonensis TaxID=1469557 RepID=UPI00053E764F|nr:hypothetical protein [Lacinutrix jangbogonensis]
MKKNNLTDTEVILIDLYYCGHFEKDKIAKRLFVSSAKLSKIEKSIFKKFKSNCWFLIIKKAFELNILVKEKNSTLDIQKEAKVCAKNIRIIGITEGSSDLDIKFKIYKELIRFYSKYEYSYLLKPFEEFK